MFALYLSTVVAIADEVGLILAQCELDNILDWGCRCDESFDVWGEIVPGNVNTRSRIVSQKRKLGGAQKYEDSKRTYQAQCVGVLKK